MRPASGAGPDRRRRLSSKGVGGGRVHAGDLQTRTTPSAGQARPGLALRLDSREPLIRLAPDQLETELVHGALAVTGGNPWAVARLLGLSRAPSMNPSNGLGSAGAEGALPPTMGAPPARPSGNMTGLRGCWIRPAGGRTGCAARLAGGDEVSEAFYTQPVGLGRLGGHARLWAHIQHFVGKGLDDLRRHRLQCRPRRPSRPERRTIAGCRGPPLFDSLAGHRPSETP